MVKSLHSKGTCRHDKNIVKSNWHSTEVPATYYANIGMVMVKSMHSKGTCRQDKNIVKKYWHSAEELATLTMTISYIVMVKTLHRQVPQ